MTPYVIFLFQVPLVGLIAAGVLPRELYVLWALVLVGYFLWERLERALIFFVASLPFFLAMPLAPAFDTMNVWRILVLVLFLKWMYEKIRSKNVQSASPYEFKIQKLENQGFYSGSPEPKTRGRWSKFKITVQDSKSYILTGLFFVLVIFSIALNNAWGIGLKRFLFFLNIFMLVPVVRYLMQREDFFPKLAKAVWVSLAVILFVGFLQLALTFVAPIDQFVGWWASHVTKTYYGGRLNEYILFDNNWFTYEPGKIPTLRMFSIFHESHALGLYIILALPFLGYLFWRRTSYNNILEVEPALDAFVSSVPPFSKVMSPEATTLRQEGRKTVRKLLFSRAFLSVFGLPLLAVVLTGTRGLWVSVIGPVCLVVLLLLRRSILRKSPYPVASLRVHPPKLRNQFCRDFRNMALRNMAALLLLFALLFPVGSALGFLEQQAQSAGGGEEDIGVGLKRLRSVFDLQETSNAGRFGIWKQTLPAILERPFFGVGLGNFGSVMGSGADLRFSAHNLYLHIAAELGIPALLVVMIIFALVFRTAMRLYEILFLFSLAWLLVASVFDVTLLDQRVLTLFSLTMGAVSVLGKEGSALGCEEGCDVVSESRRVSVR